MPDMLDIEKIKRKYKPSYADYGKALIANALTAHNNERIIDKESLDKIANRAYKAAGYQGDTPETIYKTIISDFILSNETTRLHALIINRQLENLKNLASSLSFSLEVLETAETQMKTNKDKNGVLNKANEIINDMDDIDIIHNLIEGLDNLKNVVAYSYMYATVWNYFIFVLGSELGYIKPQYTYSVDELIDLIIELLDELIFQINRFQITEKFQKNKFDILNQHLLEAIQLANYLRNCNISNTSSEIIDGMVIKILDEPVTTLHVSFGVVLFSITTDEYSSFIDNYQQLISSITEKQDIHE